MIEIRGVDLIPNTVNVGQYFLIRADVKYIEEIFTWGDLISDTWGGMSTMTWGDLFIYRNPDHRETRRYSGNFACGQDFTF